MHVDLGVWWKLATLASVVNILIWLVAGGLWWKVLGLWVSSSPANKGGLIQPPGASLFRHVTHAPYKDKCGI